MINSFPINVDTPKFGGVSFCILASLANIFKYPLTVLLGIFLTTDEIRHLLIYLLTISISSFVKPLLKSLPLLLLGCFLRLFVVVQKT